MRYPHVPPSTSFDEAGVHFHPLESTAFLIVAEVDDPCQNAIELEQY